VTLDYLVAENKPWTAYAELSNTGTKQTNEWRERFGFVHNQLTRSDDILRLDYATAGFDRSHAVNVDYSFPILSDRVRARGLRRMVPVRRFRCRFRGRDLRRRERLGAAPRRHDRLATQRLLPRPGHRPQVAVDRCRELRWGRKAATTS
jgi:hypothetical protein